VCVCVCVCSRKTETETKIERQRDGERQRLTISLEPWILLCLKPDTLDFLVTRTSIFLPIETHIPIHTYNSNYDTYIYIHMMLDQTVLKC